MPSPDHASLLAAMMSLGAALQKRLNARLSMHGLGWTDYLVLQTLASEPERTMRRIDLAERVGLSPSGVTRLLNPMEKIGLVEKQSSNHDARVSLVSLSPVGERVLHESSVAVNDLAETCFKQFNEPHRQDLLNTLKQLKSAV